MTARPWVVIDFETRSARPIGVGVDEYAAHASTDALCIAWQWPDKPVLVVDLADGPPTELMQHVADGGAVVAHNAAFELAIWAMLHKRRPGIWPALRPEQTHCTMAMAQTCALPASLENLAGAINLPLRKDAEGKKVMLTMAAPAKLVLAERKHVAQHGAGAALAGKTYAHGHYWHDTPALRERLMEYCKVDVEVQTLAWLALPKLSERERKIWLLDYRINRRGVGIDRGGCMAAAQLLEQAAADLDAELNALTGGHVPSARAAVALRDWLQWFGMPPDIRDGLSCAPGGLILDDMRKTTVENALPKATGAVRRALEIRQIVSKSSTAKLSPMLEMSQTDGRARGTLNYHRATTGRWAGSGIQTQNLPRTPKGWKAKDAEEAIRAIKAAVVNPS